MVYYKKTHTNLMKNRNQNILLAQKKGYKKICGQGTGLCDQEHLDSELKNTEDVFVANERG